MLVKIIKYSENNLFGNWYKNLIGEEFEVVSGMGFYMIEDKNSLYHWKYITMDDCEIVYKGFIM